MPKLCTQEEHSADMGLRSDSHPAAGVGRQDWHVGAQASLWNISDIGSESSAETEKRNLKLDTWESLWEQLSIVGTFSWT